MNECLCPSVIANVIFYIYYYLCVYYSEWARHSFRCHTLVTSLF